MAAEADSRSGGGRLAMGAGRGGRAGLAVLSSAALLALAACSGGSSGAAPGSSSGNGGTPVKGGTLNMLGVGDVDYMDPNISYYSGGYVAMRLISRQLYTYSGQASNAGQTVPDLATDQPKLSADGLTATITIRQGAKWDTTPARQITAEDFIRGVKRTCNPAQPFSGTPDFQDLLVGYTQFCDGFKKVGQTATAIAGYLNANQISGVKQGGDDRTVVLTLSHPASYLADMLTLTAFTPAPKEYDAYVPASNDLAQHLVSSGPYKLTKYDPTKTILMDRNPAWDGATDPVRKAYVDKIVIDETRSQESVQQQLETGSPSADMEWDTFPPPSVLPRLISAKDPKLTLGTTSSSNPYIVFNTVSPSNNGAMGKIPVRQALEQALNRTTIIQAMGGPKVYPPLTHVLPKVIIGGEQDFDLYPHDAAKAKAALAAAGYPNGLTIKVLYRSKAAAAVKAFSTLQQDLKESGITVEGVPSPNADFYTKYLQQESVAKRGVWDLAIAGWGADWHGNAALSYFNPLFSGKNSFPPSGSNFGFYDSPATNTAIATAIAAKTVEEAGQAWAKVDRQVMEDAAFFPITNPNWPVYHAEQTKNTVYVDQLQQYDPANVWLDPAKNGG